PAAPTTTPPAGAPVLIIVPTRQDLTIIFFFNVSATPGSYTLSLHDALPIFEGIDLQLVPIRPGLVYGTYRYRVRYGAVGSVHQADRKSTRLNSSHDQISYAVFCLKKKTRDRGSAVRRSLVDGERLSWSGPHR